jgi:hypothetical protein
MSYTACESEERIKRLFLLKKNLSATVNTVVQKEVENVYVAGRPKGLSLACKD